MNNSVVVVSVGAGYAYGPQGYTHHSLEDIAVMRSLPNLDVIIPADPIETRKVTEFLVKSLNPSYLRLGKSNEMNINIGDPMLKYGKVNEIVSGESGTILFVGSIGTTAMKASRELFKQGLDVSVASVPFLTNLDIKYLTSAASKGPIVTIEEHSSRGGFGSAVLEFLNREKIKAVIGIVTAAQKNLSQIGNQEFLREANGLDVNELVRTFKALQEA
jgi:transketolase